METKKFLNSNKFSWTLYYLTSNNTDALPPFLAPKGPFRKPKTMWGWILFNEGCVPRFRWRGGAQIAPILKLIMKKINK